MSALLGKAGKKLFEQHLEQYAPADPLYESYTDERGRQKRRKRDLPAGLSARDAAILRSVKRRAHYLDKGFNLCGMRFGWTFLISLIPVVGDVADASLNYYLVVRKARQADLPPWLVRRMMVNNAFSFGISFVPIAGDLILAMFKANSRNAALLEEYLRLRGEEFLKLHPEGSVEVVKPKKKGFFTSKKTTAAAKAGLSESDIEQVKPGSGLRPGETVEELDILPNEPAMEGDGNNGNRSFWSMFKSKKRDDGPSIESTGNKGGLVENVSSNGNPSGSGA